MLVRSRQESVSAAVDSQADLASVAVHPQPESDWDLEQLLAV